MAGIIPPGRLVYGMQLPIQSQSPIYAEPWEASAGAAELAEVARHCDAAGFFYVAVCDHVAIPKPSDEKMSTSWWDTLTTLGWLAGITERVHLLSHVYVLPYRHPLMTAKGFSTLDALSGGRAVLGVGAGHVEAEFDLLGADFAGRGAVLDDALDVVRAAFLDEYPKVETATWAVADAGLRPRPVRPGGPPIWVGGSSRPAIRRAATKGDGWLPQGPPPDGMRAAIARIHDLRAEAGRADEAFDLGINPEPIHLGEPGWNVGKHTLTGAPEPIAERLRAYGQLGANQLQVRFRSRSVTELCDQIDAFGAEVAPLLND
ncbi:MAG: TIGR03619 family F420-dependent LLM class oxidoreductase [Acidimicrobiales bacterium]